MGYESRLYVVDKLDDYGEVITVFNLYKVPSVANKMRKYPATNLHIYSGDKKLQGIVMVSRLLKSRLRMQYRSLKVLLKLNLIEDLPPA